MLYSIADKLYDREWRNVAKQGLYLKAWFLKDGVTLSGIELIKRESEWLSALQVSQVMAGVEGSMFERRP